MFRLAFLALLLAPAAAWGTGRPSVALGRSQTRLFADMPAAFSEAPAPEPEPVMPEPISMPEPEEEITGGLVPVNAENIETFSGVLGGAFGLFLTGTLPLAAMTALVGNYVSKLDNDAGAAVRGASQAGIKTYNFVSSTSEKYQIGDKIGNAVNSAVESIKKADTTEAKIATKVDSTVRSFADKVKEIDQEFDVTGKAKELLWVAGDIGTKALDKTLQYIDENNITEKVTSRVKSVVDSAKARAAKANE